MALGPAVRRLMGPAEPFVARAYRRFFYDPRTLTAALATRFAPSRILEVGCGEGLLSEELARTFPSAFLTGIDIAGTPGRLFGLDRSRTEFRIESLSSVVARAPGTFDMVVVGDVVHHVPPGERHAFIADAAKAARDDGCLVIKDWERRANVVHALNWFSDRVISGEAVHYLSGRELEALIHEALPGRKVIDRLRLAPWRNNLAFVIGVGA
ncbi:MAG: methyltransferase domain-containing protein [Anaeromyxobacteraceae bacterium]